MRTKSIMRMQVIIVGCVLFLPTPIFARKNTDVVVMKNGDHLTGQIKGLSSGVLYMSMEYILGTSSVEWSKVAHLESTQLFFVTTEDGSVYTGTLQTTNTRGDSPLEVAVVETSRKEVINSSRIISMATTSTKFLERFNGNIDTGIIYSKGNQSTQYNIASQVAYPRERWAAEGSFNSTLSVSTGAPPSTRNQVGLDAFRLMHWNNWFYEGVGGYLQSTEQGIVHQGTFGGGIGRFLKNTEQARISVLAGFAGQDTIYRQNIPPQNLAFYLIAAKLQFFQFDKTNGTLSALLLPTIGERNRVKFQLNSTYYIKLVGNLSWNISVYGNWDSLPPDGLPSSDYGSSSGLTWTFGTSR